jgi:hypothetical protein
MIRPLVLVCAISVCFVLTANAQVTNQPTDFNQMMIDRLVSEIRDIHEFYMSAPTPDGCGTSFNERVKCRNKFIKAKFEKIKNERQEEYGKYRLRMEKEKSCTSSSGRRKVCYGELRAPENHIMIPASLTKFGKGFENQPYITPDSSLILWSIKKTGRGRNAGGVTIQTRYKEEAITRFINKEITVLRAALKQHNLPDDLSIDP